MEEAYWKQFMATGRIEDYLHFKGVSEDREKGKREVEYSKNKGERTNAGIGKCDGHCT